MTQALGIWAELVEAYHGKNGYGGKTAEIYMHRLMPDSPTARLYDPEKDKVDSMFRKAHEARVRNANASLFAILSLFEREWPCRVFVNDRFLGDWVTSAGFDHRVHVHVEPKPWEHR